MRNKRGGRLLLAGAALLLAAALLTAYNLCSEAAGERAARQIAASLAALLPAQDSSAVTTAEQMQTVTIDGEDYIGVLEIPSLGFSVPVNNVLDDARLKKSPCRYAGSFLTGDLIIGGHNYKKNFGNLKLLSPGDEVTLTDVDGFVYRYTVTEIETLRGDDVAGMKAGDWDLTLFTCTLGGARRVTVRCQRADAQS